MGFNKRKMEDRRRKAAEQVLCGAQRQQVGQRVSGMADMGLSRAAGICFAILFAASTALAGDLPDPKFTPGDADSSLTKEAICSPGASKSRRYVRAELKRKVYALYGMTPDGDLCPCEVDHLIPLALGGTNKLRNLWPESHSTKPWNSLAKDRLERRLHDDVCHGIIELGATQREIATDWIAAYEVRFGEP
jgi:hypothetical protein